MDPRNATVAVVGVGGLGGALARGLLAHGLPGQRLVLCDVQADKVAAAAGKSGARVVPEPAEAAAAADVVVVCVKPPDVMHALDRIASQVKPHTVVLSAAAGVRLVKLREALGAHG
jgi:pyrroline-5-carboxylate reductase